MSTIRDWATCLCFAALAAAIIQMILPGGSSEKIMKLVIGAFFLCCVVSPLLTQNHILTLNTNLKQTSGEISTQRLDDELDRELKQQIEQRLEIVIRQSLSSTGADINKILISMDTLEDNSISISTIDIVLNECTPAEKSAVENAVMQSLSIMPRISLSRSQPLEVKQ